MESFGGLAGVLESPKKVNMILEMDNISTTGLTDN